ncbi:MAG: 50S ribosomal protein L17 [Bacteroidetes bacterium RIFCSPLOWO2_02_FULL_36_8]|nr:MAG: 50S ribosomal protein L17 [Bacteroidetes bacterium RIFCSPLOWO2_02_FULL_36_8]OFY68821.1 MAG: 50S ribosomal protein L17 [Bacteroidetes bacterium RIFCSPLOWO2_12_FULL_37_12]
MRHLNKFKHLSRKAGHRSALLSNLACSLIKYKRIETTEAKAKSLRRFIEPILTCSKTDTTHSRRVVFSKLGDKYAVKELFASISGKVINRPGGYTRILKTRTRPGDSAHLCLIELVDFAQLPTAETGKAKAKRKKTRRSKGKTEQKAEAKQTEKVENAK